MKCKNLEHQYKTKACNDLSRLNAFEDKECNNIKKIKTT